MPQRVRGESTLPRRFGAVASALILTLAAAPAGAEVIEEIIAWVDGDIITLSDFKTEEQQLVQSLFSEFTGDDLDREVKQVREGLLLQLIDQKILVHRASRMFDLERMGDAFYDLFKEQRGITDDEEFAKLLDQQGMTLEAFKARLIDRWGPERVISFEVSNRISIGDREVELYYETHPDEFKIAGEVTLREVVLLDRGEPAPSRRAEADQILARLSEPDADFAEIAREVSEAGTASSGGLLGPLKQGELSKQLEEIAFSLEPGKISDVLETPYGFHILKVEERTDPRKQTLDEVRDDIRRKLEDRRYIADLDRFLEKARNEADVHVNPKYLDRLPESLRESLSAAN